MGERRDLIVIDAGQPVDRLGQAEERGEDGRGEDHALARLEHHRENVRLAEVLVVAILNLDEGMPLRQEVRGAKVQREAEGCDAEGGGDEEDDAEHPVPPRDQPVGETLHAGRASHSPMAQVSTWGLASMPVTYSVSDRI